MKLTFSPALLIGTTALCFSGQTWSADLPDCQDAAALGSVCLMKAKDLRPTQFSVGNVAVECQKQEIEKKHEKGTLEGYLANKSKHIPAVVGPDSHFYITDHHHLSTAVYRAKKGDWIGKNQKLHITVLENFHGTGISIEEFWNIMAMQKNVWPYDEKGKEVKDYGNKLPSMDMGNLKDNPYRTLSRWIRESCGYIKKGKDQCLALKATAKEPTAPYFMEFYWARFLRNQLGKNNSDLNSPQELIDSYPEAIQAALSKKKTDEFFEAQGLDAVDYGQNQKGTYLHLDFSKNACETWYLKKTDHRFTLNISCNE